VFYQFIFAILPEHYYGPVLYVFLTFFTFIFEIPWNNKSTESPPLGQIPLSAQHGHTFAKNTKLNNTNIV